MDSDDQAVRLVELEIKRDRTLSELDAVQEAQRSAKKTLTAYLPRPSAIIQQYTTALERDDIPEERQKQLYDEWQKFLSSTTDEFRDLVAEWERLRLQERILTRMLRELDRQIDEVKQALL